MQFWLIFGPDISIPQQGYLSSFQYIVKKVDILLDILGLNHGLIIQWR